MDTQIWLKFFVACWLIALSPGSGAILAMTHGLSYGVRKASSTVLGLQLGLILLLIIAGAGVGSLLVTSAFLFAVVKAVGALYLIYLGVRQCLSKKQLVIPSEAKPDTLSTTTTWQRVVSGFLTNATNPKGILFMVAVLPSFINVHQSVSMQLLVMGLTMVMVDVVVMHGYAFSASLLRKWLRTERASDYLNKGFGVLLIVIGFGLFFVRPEASVSIKA